MRGSPMLRSLAGAAVLLIAAAGVGGPAGAADTLRDVMPSGPPIFVPPPSYDVLFGLYGGGGKIQADDDPYRIFGAEGSVNFAFGPGNVYIDGRGENGFETDANTY